MFPSFRATSTSSGLASGLNAFKLMLTLVSPKPIAKKCIAVPVPNGRTLPPEELVSKIRQRGVEAVSYDLTGDRALSDIVDLAKADNDNITYQTSSGSAAVKTISYSITQLNLSSAVLSSYQIGSADRVEASSIASQTYTGYAIEPKIELVTSSTTKVPIPSSLYEDPAYTDNINAGTEAKAVVKFSGTMYSGEKALTFTINKAAQTVKAKVATKTVKVKKVKKKAQTVKPITSVTKKAGAVTYKKVSGSAKLTINKTTGKVTVKKKTKKGTYKAKIRVTAAGSANYKSAYTDVTVTIKVKK